MNQTENAIVLLEQLQWLEQVLNLRLQNYFKKTGEEPKEVVVPAPPEPTYPDVPIAIFIREKNLNPDERLLLMAALAPHVNPDFYNSIISVYVKEGNFPILGLIKGDQFRGYMPTGATAVFILAGVELIKRLSVQQLFNEDHLFAKQQVLHLEAPADGDPAMTGKIVMAQDYIDRFLTGSFTRPRFGQNFPGERITTLLNWKDLVLNGETLEQVYELKKWLRHKDLLLKTNKRVKPGYRALFYGPPGTGKTLTSCLLGKKLNEEDPDEQEYDVYRVDLSLVVSKYIGETEKNLSKLFDKAEYKNWILFFDEADALFGKRTSVRDSNDKYANQEVSYLLQKIENFNGMIILASNFKSNIDPAFARRFQSIIHFPLPSQSERLQLWEGIFNNGILEDRQELEAISYKYELSGASILNVAQGCFLKKIDSNGKMEKIGKKDIESGIAREFNKEGKILK